METKKTKTKTQAKTVKKTASKAAKKPVVENREERKAYYVINGKAEGKFVDI